MTIWARPGATRQESAQETNPTVARRPASWLRLPVAQRVGARGVSVGVVGGVLVVPPRIVTGTRVRWLSMLTVFHPLPGVAPAVKMAVVQPFWRWPVAGDSVPSDDEKPIWAFSEGTPVLTLNPLAISKAATSACSPGLRVIELPIGSSSIPVSSLRGPISAASLRLSSVSTQQLTSSQPAAPEPALQPNQFCAASSVPEAVLSTPRWVVPTNRLV